MAQPAITLSDGTTTVTLDPDLQWTDEWAWNAIEQTVERSITGALLIDTAEKTNGRPITLAPADDASGWMTRAVLEQLVAWEAVPAKTLILTLRGVPRDVIYRRNDGPAIDARPVVFVADPAPGGFGDWYIATLRLMEI